MDVHLQRGLYIGVTQNFRQRFDIHGILLSFGKILPCVKDRFGYSASTAVTVPLRNASCLFSTVSKEITGVVASRQWTP